MKKILTILLIIYSTNDSFAWSGYDYETGSYIEIGSGNLVREGESIEIYDYDDGSYHDVDVQEMNNNEITVYDNETEEDRTFSMN